MIHCYIVVIVLTANIAAFVVGYALTWCSPMGIKLNSTDPELHFGHHINLEELQWICSLMPLGASMGPFLFGFSAAKLGRKLSIILLGVPFFLCFLTLAFVRNLAAYYVARFLTGLSMGGTFAVVPMYIGEISPDAYRGALASTFNCANTAGMILTYSLGPFVSIMIFNVVLAMIPFWFMILFAVLAPETPHYLMMRGKRDKAERALDKLRGKPPEGETHDAELDKIQENIDKSGKVKFTNLFKSRAVVRAFMIACALMLFQQFSGISAILFYTQKIFEASGSTLKAYYPPMIIAWILFTTSFISPLLADRAGRKMLLYISAAGMLAAHIPLGTYYYLLENAKSPEKSLVKNVHWLPIASLILYIITHNIGYGPIPWVMLGELYPPNVRSLATALTASFCRFLAFLVVRFFGSLYEGIGLGPSFWLFGGFCLLALIFTIFCVIETKGKSFQEIQDILAS